MLTCYTGLLFASFSNNLVIGLLRYTYHQISTYSVWEYILCTHIVFICIHLYSSVRFSVRQTGPRIQKPIKNLAVHFENSYYSIAGIWMSMMPFNWNTIGGITQPHSEWVRLGGFLIARGATVHPFACINGLVSENIYGNPLCFMNKTWKNKTQETKKPIQQTTCFHHWIVRWRSSQ